MREGPVTSGLIGEWYAAFFDPPERHWWSRFLRPGFRHVAAFGYCPEMAAWVVYDVTLRRTWLQLLTSDQMDAWVAALPTHRTIVRLRARNDSAPARLGFWCAPAVAHLLGVASRALRPEALHRDLVALGAVPAFEGQPA